MSSDSHPNRMTMCEELFTLSKNTLRLNPLKNFENFFEKRNVKESPNNVMPGIPYQICGLTDLIKVLLKRQNCTFMKS